MGKEFIQIFSEMGLISGVLLTLGILFCTIEIFVPGVGFFGITGAISTVAGIIYRAIEGVTFFQFVLLILLIASIFVFALLCLIILIKMGVVSDRGLFSTSTALPRDYGNSKEYKKLIGKIGKTVTEMKLAGRVKIRGKIYDAISEQNYINKGKFVKVVRLENSYIVVRRYWD